MLGIGTPDRFTIRFHAICICLLALGLARLRQRAAALMRYESEEMARVASRIIALIAAMIERARREEYTQEYLTQVYGRTARNRPGCAMRPDKQITYDFLFGFGTNAHHYLDRSPEGAKAQSRLLPVQARHLKRISKVLDEMRIGSNLPNFGEESSSWGPFLKCAHEAITGTAHFDRIQEKELLENPPTSFRDRKVVSSHPGKQAILIADDKPFIGVPPQVTDFVGRVNELNHLHVILMPTAAQSVGRAALQGMGGVGKTSLAVEYAHRFRDSFAGIWWCRAESRASVATSLAALADRLGGAPIQGDIEKSASVALHKIAEAATPWLLIYDNAPSPTDIVNLLPAAGARVLITSRFPFWEKWAEEIALDALPMDDAIKFLTKSAKFVDHREAERLAKALGCLPLALDHALAFCRHTQMRFDEYATTITELIEVVPAGQVYPNSVAATFDLAIVEARRQMPSTDVMMAFLALCSPDPIPLTLLEGAIEGGVERAKTIGLLAEMSLLKHTPYEDGTSAETVHPLVQMVARKRSEEEGNLGRAADHIISRLFKIYPHDALKESRSWSTCDQLTPHLVASITNVIKHKLSYDTRLTLAEIADRAGAYYQARGAYEEAELLFQISLGIHVQICGLRHSKTAVSGAHLGDLLLTRGDYPGAHLLLKQALEIFDETSEPDSSQLAGILDGLGLSYGERGELDVAAQMLKRALIIREGKFGPESMELCKSLNALAIIMRKQRNHEEAFALISRAVTICVLNSNPIGLVDGLHNLAALQFERGFRAQGQAQCKEALRVLESVVGPDHPDLLVVLQSLGIMTLLCGDKARAWEIFKRVHTISESTFGHESTAVAMAMNRLAEMYQIEGDLTKAGELLEEALALHERLLGPMYTETNMVKYNLAYLRCETGQYQEALALGKACLAAFESRANASWTLQAARITVQALEGLGQSHEASAMRAKYKTDSPK